MNHIVFTINYLELLKIKYRRNVVLYNLDLHVSLGVDDVLVHLNFPVTIFLEKQILITKKAK